MALTPTANMGLVKPEVNVDIGPTWAELLNAMFDLIDAHTHASGSGAKVTPAGLNINSNLEFNANNAIELRSVRLENNGANLNSVDDKRCLYVVGNDLWYNDGASVQIKLTNLGSINTPALGNFLPSTPGSYPYTVTSGDSNRILRVTTSSARTINLPLATTSMMFGIKDITGSAATNNISVVPSGTNKIDGVNATKVLNVNRGWWWFLSNGVDEWDVAYCTS